MKIPIYSLATLALLPLPAFARDTSKPDRPNILFAISDDQSFPHTSFAGSAFVQTPAFDRVAREGIYFSNCYAASPGCAPSRSALVTGRHHWQNGSSGQHGSAWLKRHVPFIDLLDDNGYVTGRTGKGVSPFAYGDSPRFPWRATDAGGLTHSDINYTPGSDDDERPATGIFADNYFENFKYFMEEVRENKPFFFWYGGVEPHRAFEEDSWKRHGKRLEDVDVPGFYPDHPVIRGDLLDYAVEIEWFDLHLQRMIDYLEEIGELENTIIVVTSDNGMAFPRAKANCYAYGLHVPLAVRYPKAFPGGRVVDDLIGFIDFAPTFLELTGTPVDGMLPIRGKSFTPLLESEKEGLIEASEKYLFAGRERHSSARYQNWGYPQRAVRNQQFLLVWNLKPDRWPSGDPQRFDPDTHELYPMFGLDENGKHQWGWAFTDIDGSPTKALLIENRQDPEFRRFFDLAHAKRPEFELFDLQHDPYCLTNLIGDPHHSAVEAALKRVLLVELHASEDPRLVGPDPDIFEAYPRYTGPMSYFPKPPDPE